MSRRCFLSQNALKMKIEKLQRVTFNKEPVSLLCPGVIRTALGPGDMDREQREHYQVVIEAKDMAGQRGGLTGTTVVNITLTDVNDNPPRFTQRKIKVPRRERLPVNDNPPPRLPPLVTPACPVKSCKAGKHRLPRPYSRLAGIEHLADKTQIVSVGVSLLLLLAAGGAAAPSASKQLQ